MTSKISFSNTASINGYRYPIKKFMPSSETPKSITKEKLKPGDFIVAKQKNNAEVVAKGFVSSIDDKKITVIMGNNPITQVITDNMANKLDITKQGSLRILA